MTRTISAIAVDDARHARSFRGLTGRVRAQREPDVVCESPESLKMTEQLINGVQLVKIWATISKSQRSNQM